MQKTTKMRLIEAKSGHDIRQVLHDAYEAGGSIQGACEEITRRFDEPMSTGLFSDWMGLLDGSIRSSLLFDGFELLATEPAEEPAGAAA